MDELKKAIETMIETGWEADYEHGTRTFTLKPTGVNVWTGGEKTRLYIETYRNKYPTIDKLYYDPDDDDFHFTLAYISKGKAKHVRAAIHEFIEAVRELTN